MFTPHPYPLTTILDMVIVFILGIVLILFLRYFFLANVLKKKKIAKWDLSIQFQKMAILPIVIGFALLNNICPELGHCRPFLVQVLMVSTGLFLVLFGIVFLFGYWKR